MVVDPKGSTTFGENALYGPAYRGWNKLLAQLIDLGVDVNAEGSFANLVKFGYALETAGDFIVLRNCTFAPQEGGKLALHLLADLYLMP